MAGTPQRYWDPGSPSQGDSRALQLPIATHFFTASISWLKLRRAVLRPVFLVLKVERGDGPGQWPPGPTVLIARHSARRLRPDRTRTEARTTLASPGGLSVGRQIGRGSPVFSQHRDSALRTDDKQDKPFLFAQNSDTKQHDGRYSTSEICRRSDLRRRPRLFRGQSSTQIGTR